MVILLFSCLFVKRSDRCVVNQVYTNKSNEVGVVTIEARRWQLRTTRGAGVSEC